MNLRDEIDRQNLRDGGEDELGRCGRRAKIDDGVAESTTSRIGDR